MTANVSVLALVHAAALRDRIGRALAPAIADGWLFADIGADEAVDRLTSEPWSCAIVEARLAGERDAAWWTALAEVAPGTAFLVVARDYDDHAASRALAAGAQDYLCAADTERMARAVEHAVARQQRLEQQRGAQRDTAVSRRCSRTGAVDGAALESLPLHQILDRHRCRKPVTAMLVAVDSFASTRQSPRESRQKPSWDATRDELLREAVRRVRLLTRPGDLLARVGDGALLLLLPATASGAAAALADRVRRALQVQPATVDGRSLTATVAIGVAAVPPHTRFGDAVDRARDALTAARSAGRDGTASVDAQAPGRRWALRALPGGGSRVSRWLR